MERTYMVFTENPVFRQSAYKIFGGKYLYQLSSLPSVYIVDGDLYTTTQTRINMNSEKHIAFTIIDRGDTYGVKISSMTLDSFPEQYRSIDSKHLETLWNTYYYTNALNGRAEKLDSLFYFIADFLEEVNRFQKRKERQ